MRPSWCSRGAALLWLLTFLLRLFDGVFASVVPRNVAVSQPQLSLDSPSIEHLGEITTSRVRVHPRLRSLLDALELMQEKYFDVFTGTWPTAIDWTAAVLGTHVSATLSSLVSSLQALDLSCSDRLVWENIIGQYFAHTSIFYFGENAFGLRNQAYDDMLWVVLGWLESIKFTKMYSLGYWEASGRKHTSGSWHGMQFSLTAAHRARIFYDLASKGWDTDLCDGGMNWNPALVPYKNAITNELFISASISMYLYFPGDNNTSPYLSDTEGGEFGGPHDPLYLENAIRAYKWLQDSSMQSSEGLYQDGFHISGWRKYSNGTIDPGSRHCDVLNTMIYTYNQGVLLTACKGLWMATGGRAYLEDGHALVENVIRATGWPGRDMSWHGLGRGGILEEFCDHDGYCSQDGQTFKGIFFNHLTEFCRPLWGFEEEFIAARLEVGPDGDIYHNHKARCAAYGGWIAHNAEAAIVTRDSDGLFGMWWGREYPLAEFTPDASHHTQLPPDAIDHMNDRSNLTDGLWGPRPVSGTRSVQSEKIQDVNDRGRGRSVETQSGGLAVLRADWTWRSLLGK